MNNESIKRVMVILRALNKNHLLSFTDKYLNIQLHSSPEEFWKERIEHYYIEVGNLLHSEGLDSTGLSDALENAWEVIGGRAKENSFVFIRTTFGGAAGVAGAAGILRTPPFPIPPLTWPSILVPLIIAGLEGIGVYHVFKGWQADELWKMFLDRAFKNIAILVGADNQIFEELKMPNTNLVADDENLIQVLAKATNDDLEPLVQYILKAEFTESLSCSESYKKFYPDHQKYVDAIAQEIRLFGGNTLVNAARDALNKLGGVFDTKLIADSVAYIEIVQDVADHIKAPYSKNADVTLIEQAILIKIVEQSWEKMSDQERKDFLDNFGISYASGIPKSLPLVALQAAIKMSGFAAYRLAVLVANAIAKVLLGRGLTLAANAALTRWISVLVGPIGWAITALWTILDIAGPAYRVTLPCVVHIATLRQQQLLCYCTKCSSPYSGNPKFCPECGEKLN